MSRKYFNSETLKKILHILVENSKMNNLEPVLNRYKHIINKKTYTGFTLLYFAFYYKKFAIVDALIKNGADVNLTSNLFDYAYNNRDIILINKLVNLGVIITDFNIKKDIYNTHLTTETKKNIIDSIIYRRNITNLLWIMSNSNILPVEMFIYIKQFITIDKYIYGTYTLDDIKLLNKNNIKTI